MKKETRILFIELYEHAIYLTWVIGIFIGIHIEGIYRYAPPEASETPTSWLITSHSHLLLMTLLLFFLNRRFRETLETRKWPNYWTEGLLITGLIGAIMVSLNYYLLGAVEYGAQLQMLTLLEKMSYGGVAWGSTIYALSIMGYVVLAIIARIMR